MRRVPELDSLRAIAAIAVVWSHAAQASPGFRFAPIVHWGWSAVDLFFVVSGYLITSIILEAQKSKHFLLNFYARRSLRIWPIYYLALFAFALVNLVLGQPYPMDGLPRYLAYLQNVSHYWGGQDPPFCKGFAHTWSLAVEEQFYLIWPAVVLFSGRKRLSQISLGVIALATVARGCGLDAQLLLTRSDGLALGGLLAALVGNRESFERNRRLYRRGSILLICFGLTAWPFFRVPAATGFNAASSLELLAINLFFVGCVGFCVCSTGRRETACLRHPALAYVGKVSYGLYLYHNLAISLLPRWTKVQEQPPILMILALLVSFGLAALSWEWLEKPILSLKDRFPYDRPTKFGSQTRASEVKWLLEN